MVDVENDLRRSTVAHGALVGQVPKQTEKISGLDRLAVVGVACLTHAIEQPSEIFAAPIAPRIGARESSKTLQSVGSLPQRLLLMVGAGFDDACQFGHELLCEAPRDEVVVRRWVEPESFEKAGHA